MSETLKPHNFQVHFLKTHPGPFAALRARKKTLEIRRADRDFGEGDTLWLEEFDPDTQTRSGEVEVRIVTHVLPGGQYGIEPGFCALSITDDLNRRPTDPRLEALNCIADDYMTSEHHHPGYVLIPTAKFERLAGISVTQIADGEPDTDAVCTTCRWRGGHSPDCPRKDDPWPTVPTDPKGSGLDREDDERWHQAAYCLHQAGYHDLGEFIDAQRELLALLPPDDELSRLKAELEAVRGERGEAQSVTTAWQEIFDGLDAHLRDRIAMRDQADPEAYLRILHGYVANVIRSSQQITASRWADYKRHREALEAAEARATALEERVRGLEEALEEARATFEGYARGHYAKQTPDGDAKALRNAKMAAKCVAALTESKAHQSEGGE